MSGQTSMSKPTVIADKQFLHTVKNANTINVGPRQYGGRDLGEYFIRLDDIATVKRGIQTGKNDFFCLTRAEVDELGLPDEVLAPLVKRASEMGDYTYTPADWQAARENDQLCWLLYHTTDLDRPADNDALEAYLNTITDEQIADSYTFRNRDPWYVVDRRTPPDLLFTYMSRGRARFVVNTAEVRNLNNIHGIWLDEGYANSLVDTLALAGYLNSTLAAQELQTHGHKRAEGLSKVEPNDLEDVLVPDPKALPMEVCERLGKRFTALDDASRAEDEETMADIRAALSREVKVWYAAEARNRLDAQLETITPAERRPYWTGH